MTRTAASESSFGMNESVISLICVAACSTPTRRPTASAVRRSGAAIISVTTSACWPMPMTVSGVIACAPSDRETTGESAEQQRPAVDEDEQHDFERQRDQHRRQHHHAHRHQDARDDEIDDDERDVDQESHLERGLELA